ncbi:MAG: hypothetical protein O3A00_21295 [Planctomycetota bacterium]|nr:hypothetical protein [Planctomycetota bacterium]
MYKDQTYSEAKSKGRVVSSGTGSRTQDVARRVTQTPTETTETLYHQLDDDVEQTTLATGEYEFTKTTDDGWARRDESERGTKSTTLASAQQSGFIRELPTHTQDDQTTVQGLITDHSNASVSRDTTTRTTRVVNMAELLGDSSSTSTDSTDVTNRTQVDTTEKKHHRECHVVNEFVQRRLHRWRRRRLVEFVQHFRFREPSDLGISGAHRSRCDPVWNRHFQLQQSASRRSGPVGEPDWFFKLRTPH